jgi:hypothetical protein
MPETSPKTAASAETPAAIALRWGTELRALLADYDAAKQAAEKEDESSRGIAGQISELKAELKKKTNAEGDPLEVGMQMAAIEAAIRVLEGRQQRADAGRAAILDEMEDRRLPMHRTALNGMEDYLAAVYEVRFRELRAFIGKWGAVAKEDALREIVRSSRDCAPHEGILEGLRSGSLDGISAAGLAAKAFAELQSQPPAA